MKRLWIGVILLSIMLVSSMGMLLFSRSFYKGFSETLEAAADAALSGSWEDAEKNSRQAQMQWDRHHRFFASFTDHEPVEEIELLLSRLELYQHARLAIDFADTCKSLAHLCEAIDESHNLKWWSVL